MFEGEFRERESPGPAGVPPIPQVDWHTEVPVLELELLLLARIVGGPAIRGAARLASTLSAVHPRTSGLRTGPAGGTIPKVANACQRPLSDAGTLCSRMR